MPHSFLPCLSNPQHLSEFTGVAKHQEFDLPLVDYGKLNKTERGSESAGGNFARPPGMDVRQWCKSLRDVRCDTWNQVERKKGGQWAIEVLDVFAVGRSAGMGISTHTHKDKVKEGEEEEEMAAAI